MENNNIGSLGERYKIIRPIGSGGMSEVFLGHDLLLDRDVAIKKLRQQYAEDKQLLEQFHREAKSAARLKHPSIIYIYDVVSDDSGEYIVMEYVNGQTLKEYMHDHKLELNEALAIGVQLADALQEAHKNNIIHCDIKPQNILLDKNLTPKIADFGIAKMVSNQTMVYTHEVMGSVHYISPEQASGGAITASSDVYSLGIVLFEMITGHVPYEGKTAVSIAMMHVEKPIPRLQDYMEKVPAGLQDIINKALAKRSEDRYASAGDLRCDLMNLKKKLFPFNSDAFWQGSENEKDSFNQAEENEDVSATVIMEPIHGVIHPDNEVSYGESNKRDKIPGGYEGRRKVGEGIILVRKRRTFNFTKFIIMITVIVVLISLGAHYYFSKSNEELPIPDVSNMSVIVAQKILEDKEFKVEFEEKFDEENKFSAGAVMKQAPKASEKRKRGTVITLTISKGPELKTVPELAGENLAKAEQLLADVGLKLGRVDKKHVDGQNVGVVLEQDPKGLEKAPKGSSVDIVINEGDKEVPNVIGKSVSEARELIVKAGLKVGEIREITDLAAPKNVIISTSPSAGTYLAAGDVVILTIAEGSAHNNTYVDFVVPGRKTVNVEITLEDNNGKKTLYSGSQPGGVRLRQRVDYTGKAKVQMYCDNKLISEKIL